MGLGILASGVWNQLNPLDSGRTFADAGREAQLNAQGNYDTGTGLTVSSGATRSPGFQDNGLQFTDTKNALGQLSNAQPGGGGITAQLGVSDRNESSVSTGNSDQGQSGADSESINYLNDQQGLYERLLQSIRGGLTSGMQSLDQSEVQAKNEATGKQERKLRDLGTQRTDMMTEKDSALDRVDTDARQLYDNLRKLLGTASGTGSSAYRFAAPNAVARDASTKRSNVMTSFGRNERDLTTATEDTNVDFQDLLASIVQQRKQREQDLKAGVYGKEQEVQQTLAEIASQRAQAQGGGYGEQRVARQPFMDRYMSLQNDMDALPSQYSSPMAVRDLNVKTPELADFTVDKTAINANREMGASDASPYAQLLRKMRETEA